VADNPGLDAIIRQSVSDILGNPSSLPAAFLNFLPLFIAQNPVTTVPTLGAITTLAYSTSITPDSTKGPWQKITATNGTAFTINAPIAPPDTFHTRELTIEVLNSSGGAMGAITWNSVFVFNGLTWTNPATTKTRRVTFRWNGTNWIATSISGADY